MTTRAQGARSRGFTLIELLVVIAIIGILASVVIASVNSARRKGADAAIKADLAAIKTQAQVYYDTNGAYSTAGTVVEVCGAADTMFVDPTVVQAIAAANEVNGPGPAPAGVVHCTVSPGADGAWAVSADLVGGDVWCIDSTGGSREVTAVQGTGAVVCPAS